MSSTRMKRKPRNLKKMVMTDLQERDWQVADCETRRGPCTFDLFGVADLLAFSKGSTGSVMLVQVTSKANRASRLAKCKVWLDEAGWAECFNRSFVAALVDLDNVIEYQKAVPESLDRQKGGVRWVVLNRPVTVTNPWEKPSE